MRSLIFDDSEKMSLEKKNLTSLMGILLLVATRLNSQATQLCPFHENCDTSYSVFTQTCVITCTNDFETGFPAIGSGDVSITVEKLHLDSYPLIPDRSFHNLTIQSLTISNFTYLSVNSFQGVVGVESLVLQNAQDAMPFPTGSMSHLINSLKSLNIDGIPYDLVVRPSWPEIGTLTNLEALYLARNENLTEFDSEMLFNFTELTILSITYQTIANNSIKIYKLPRLNELYLENLGLEGEITSCQIHDLPNLYSLSLRKNEISRVGPAFCQFPTLGSLILSSNKFTSLTDLNCSTLIQLELDSNTIKEFNFSNLPNLQFLSLSANNITEIKDFRSQLPANLTSLDLSYNSIRSLELSNMSRLIFLYLGSNSLSLVKLENMTSLFELYISNNLLQDVHIVNAPDLQLLYLDMNKIAELDSIFIVDVDSLNNLNLRTNMLTRIPDTVSIRLFFSRLTSLANLDLSNNFITRIDNLNIFSNLTQLVNLDLNGNLLSSFPNITSLGYLEYLDMSNQNGRLTVLDSPYFLRNQRADNYTNLIYYLDKNDITGSNTRAFCTDSSDKLVLYMSSINWMSQFKCLLKQIPDATIYVTQESTNCSLKSFAMKLNVSIVELVSTGTDESSTECVETALVDDCDMINGPYSCNNQAITTSVSQPTTTSTISSTFSIPTTLCLNGTNQTTAWDFNGFVRSSWSLVGQFFQTMIQKAFTNLTS